MEQARALLRSSPDPVRRSYASETDEDLLRVLGVVSPQGTLARAEELLLCDNGDDLPLIVYQFRRSTCRADSRSRSPT